MRRLPLITLDPMQPGLVLLADVVFAACPGTRSARKVAAALVGARVPESAVGQPAIIRL